MMAPTMPDHAPAYHRRGMSAALVCACVFVATLPFYHLHAFRSAWLGLAALLVFVSGGWRELILLPLKAGWWAWIVAAAISVAFARYPFVALSEYRYEVLYTFGAWATCYTLALRHDGARWLARALIASTVAALAIGIALFAPNQPWFDLGRFGDVGSVSTFLVMVLPLFLLFALRSRPHSTERAGALVVAAACIAAGTLTLNRMFWLAASAEVMIFALFSMRHWRSRYRTASMLGVAMVVVALAVVQVLEASESRIALAAPGIGIWEFLSSDPRGELWRFAGGLIAQHPWVGTGLGKWNLADVFFARFQDPLLMHAHNVFLNRTLETGFLGLAAFAYLLVSVVIAFRRVARSADADTAAIGAAGLALVAGVIIKNLTDDFFVRQNALLFWALVGAGLGAAAARAVGAAKAARS